MPRFIDECAAACCGGKHDDAADMLSQAINKFRKAYARGWLVEGAKQHRQAQVQGPKTDGELAAAQKVAWEKMSGKVFTNPSGYAAKTLESELAKRQGAQAGKADRCPRCANQVLAQLGDFQSCVCGWNSKQVTDAVKPVEMKPEPQDAQRGLGQFVMAKLGMG